MKEVLALIDTKKQEFAQIPFIQFLQDKSIDPRQRLVWAPALSPFIMSFKDLNKLILYKEPATSKLQEMINQHAQEDSHHWTWFLQDLKLMGYNHSVNFTDTLKFIWGEETQKARSLVYNLFALCTFEDDIFMKLAIIQSIEAAGTVAFFEFTKLAQQIREVTNYNLSYFGDLHYARETGHLQVEMHDFEDFIEKIELLPIQREKAFDLVEKVFSYFTDAMHEMLEFAHKHSYEQPFVTTNSINKLVTVA